MSFSMCEHVVLTCWPTADNCFHWVVRFGHKVSHRLPNWEQFGIPYPWTLVMRADRVKTGPTLTFGTTGHVGGSWDLARLQCRSLGVEVGQPTQDRSLDWRGTDREWAAAARGAIFEKRTALFLPGTAGKRCTSFAGLNSFYICIWQTLIVHLVYIFISMHPS